MLRERKSLVVYATGAVVAGGAGGVLVARGGEPLGVALVVLGLLYARLATQRAVVAGGMLVLHRLIGSWRIPVDHVAWVDPVPTGLLRAPHLGLYSGEIVRLDPFSVPNLFVASSHAASALAARLNVPEPGWPGSGATWPIEAEGEPECTGGAGMEAAGPK